jgi:hypothetical protein
VIIVGLSSRQMSELSPKWPWLRSLASWGRVGLRIAEWQRGGDMKVYHVTGGKQPEKQNFSTALEAIDGDVKKIRVVDETPDGGGNIFPGSTDAGRHIELHDIPTKVRVLGPRYPLLDFYAFSRNTLVVPQAFKDLIDELEPNVHQFFPLELQRAKKKVGERYWFIFGQRLDTLDFAASYPPRDETGRQLAKSERLAVHIFSIQKIGKAHAWVDRVIGGQNFSSLLVDRIHSLGLTGLNCYPMDAI